MASTINDKQGALPLAKTVARLAQVNSAMDSVLRDTPNLESSEAFSQDDIDRMLADARDDLRLGGVLCDAIEAVEASTEEILQCSTVRPAIRSMGIAKRPRHFNSQTEFRAARYAKMLKAARVLRRSLQRRFPLTWNKLLEEKQW